jgi:phenylacetate-CoA ligase
MRLKLFNVALQVNGYPLNDAKLHLDQIIAVPDSSFSEYLEKRKWSIVEHHLKNNSHYRKIAGVEKFSRWEEIPIMKKADFQLPLAQRLSNGYTTKNVYINKTSGSGGDPFVFAKDKFCHALIWANIVRRFGWYGIDFNHSLQARFYGMPLDFMANNILRLKDFLSHRYRFSIFDLSDKGLEKIVAQFRKKRFDYINGYTSSIVLLAKYLQKKGIILKDICPTVKVCIVTSEMLFDDDKMLLEKQFGVPVVNEYGASELDVIAFQNPDDEWIVNAETLFVEIVDENGIVVPNGTEGRIIVTLLYNKAHPMIRYEVGDYGVLDERSTIKKPILKKLVGRTNDVAILPSGKRPAGMTFYSITKKLFGDEGNVKEFIIKQTKIDTFEIEYTSERPLTSFEIEKMEKVMATYLEPGLTYHFMRRDALQRTGAGKLKQFVSLVK